MNRTKDKNRYKNIYIRIRDFYFTYSGEINTQIYKIVYVFEKSVTH